MNHILVKPHDKKLTLQDCFDIAWKWSRNHPKCCDVFGKCYYRNEDNTNACLIGICIPDEKYYGSKVAIIQLFGIYPEVRKIFVHNIGVKALERLQRCHDGASISNYLKSVTKNLVEFAKDYNLTIPEEKKI